MRFGTKIAIAVREDLATWQKLNVTAFLASAVAGARPEVIGERYQDGSGNFYLPMFRQPVLVYTADVQSRGSAHGRALARDLDIAVYIEDMFKTGHDLDNRAAVRAVTAGEMPLVGLAVYGPKNAVDKIFKGSRCTPDPPRDAGARHHQPADHPQVVAARAAVCADPGTAALSGRLPGWTAGDRLSGHHDPRFAPNLLNLLADMGTTATGHLRIGRLPGQFPAHQDPDGRPLSKRYCRDQTDIGVPVGPGRTAPPSRDSDGGRLPLDPSARFTILPENYRELPEDAAGCPRGPGWAHQPGRTAAPRLGSARSPGPSTDRQAGKDVGACHTWLL